jgi:small GTP-binding protein
MSDTIKIVVVGDGAVGKTCLLVVYAKGEFPTEYVPTVFENYSTSVTRGHDEYDVQLWDTAGQEELESIRCLSYPNTNVVIMCFAVAEPTSFENISARWLPEVTRYTDKPALLLVGTKTDLRIGSEGVSRDSAKKLANQIGAVAYLECSAIKNEGVKEIFDQAIESALNPGSGGCCSVQ